MKGFIRKAATTAVIKGKKYSPELLLGVGLASIGVGIFFAVKGTLKVNEIIDEAEETKGLIEKYDAEEKPDYTHEDAKKDRAILMAQTGMKFVKTYWPAALCLIGGTGCILSSYGIMKKRHATLLAAYGTLDTAFKKYREKVIETIGEDKEYAMRYGKPTKAEIISTDDKGNEVKTKETAMVYNPDLDPALTNPYAMCFDDLNDEWRNDPELNKNFLLLVEQWANNKLDRDGYLLLNDLRRALGFSDTSTGCVCGWLKNEGPGYVSLGLNDASRPAIRDFRSGRECAVWILPNCPGMIYDKL